MGDGADDAERRALEEAEEGEVIEVSDEAITRAQVGTALEARPANTSLTPSISVDELVGRRSVVVDAMERAMTDGVHYGKIPGISKPALLKPGAEMLNVLFQLAPSFPDERQTYQVDEVSNHLDVKSLCVLTHIPSGLQVAEAHGACSTREKKYAYRSGALVCPVCSAPQIRKSKQQGKDEFYCWRKEGGCGATFENGTDEYASFVEQQKTAGARIDNPDLPDQWNTVLKMSEKRALIAATLMATGASDVFTQDVEDQPGPAGDSSTREPVRQNPPAHPPIPQTPGALTEAFEAAFVDREWLSQLVEAIHGSGVAFADLDQSQKNLVGQKLKTAYVRLYEMLGTKGKLEFPGPTRGEIRGVFSSVLEGVELEGPPWRMHPPEYDAGEEAYEPQTVDLDDIEGDGSAEDIPFGEPDTTSGS